MDLAYFLFSICRVCVNISSIIPDACTFMPFLFSYSFFLEVCQFHWLVQLYTEETRIERDTCTPVFIAALIIIAMTWKQPRCPPTDEWIRKLWYIYMMEYYSAIKKNTFESVLMRWAKLEPIIQSEVSQKEKHQ